MKQPELSDIASLPNTISATGMALAIDGARRIDTPTGFVELAVGRALDLVDGPVARATGHTSEFGATVDALSDKAAGLAMLVSEWRKDIAPKPALAAMFIQNTANGVATYWAMRKDPTQELKRSDDGGKAMFAQNVAVGAYAIGNLLHERRPQAGRLFRGLGHVATAVGVGYYGTRATVGYFKRAVRS